ncbi:MAG: hypothetical protein ABW190_13430, partial [Rhizobacter sp.]
NGTPRANHRHGDPPAHREFHPHFARLPGFRIPGMQLVTPRSASAKCLPCKTSFHIQWMIRRDFAAPAARDDKASECKLNSVMQKIGYGALMAPHP